MSSDDEYLLSTMFSTLRIVPEILSRLFVSFKPQSHIVNYSHIFWSTVAHFLFSVAFLIARVVDYVNRSDSRGLDLAV